MLSLLGVGGLGTAEPNQTPQRIGVYDSRAIAYAWFWTPEHQKAQNELMKTAKAAKDAGKTEEFQQLEQKLKAAQDKIHKQVFGIAPADEALTALQPRLPEIQKEANVPSLISKWDKEALTKFKGAEQIDVTELLVREFKPGEKQRKVLKDLQSRPPVPMEQLEKMRPNE